MKALIVGLGIGTLYLKVLKELGWEVVTVDSDSTKNADYHDIKHVLDQEFDLSYIGTPNFTHEELARIVANISRIVLIEKPGVINSNAWIRLIEDFPHTRFSMVKNNQYRKEMENFKKLYSECSHAVVCWNRKNCIPNPGSWFTTKSKAFGGVSRDLLPHMLSYYTALDDFEKGETLFANSEQHHSLESITDTEYGVIDRTGTYDVDDFCELLIRNRKYNWLFVCDWKSNQEDDSSITFVIPGQENRIAFELGWCPEYAYKNMIEDLVSNLNNDDFWINQNKQDIFIHKQIEAL